MLNISAMWAFTKTLRVKHTALRACTKLRQSRIPRRKHPTRSGISEWWWLQNRGDFSSSCSITGIASATHAHARTVSLKDISWHITVLSGLYLNPCWCPIICVMKDTHWHPAVARLRVSAAILRVLLVC